MFLSKSLSLPGRCRLWAAAHRARCLRRATDEHERLHRLRGRRPRRREVRVPQRQRSPPCRRARARRPPRRPRRPAGGRQGGPLGRGQEGTRDDAIGERRIPIEDESIARDLLLFETPSVPIRATETARERLRTPTDAIAIETMFLLRRPATLTDRLRIPNVPPARTRAGRPGVLRRLGHLHHPEVAPGHVRVRGGDVHRRPRPGRGARAGARQG